MALSAESKKDVHALIDAKIEAFAGKVGALVEGKVEALAAVIAERVKGELAASGVVRGELEGDSALAITPTLREKALELAPTLYASDEAAVGDEAAQDAESEAYKNFRIVGDEIHADSGRKNRPGRWLVSRVLADAGIR